VIKDSILLVDDDPEVRQTLGEALRFRGYTLEMASSAEEALALLARKTFALLVTDLHMPDRSGLDLIARTRLDYPDMPSILITGFATLETALLALKQGAYDFIRKPFSFAEIEAVMNRTLEHARLLRRLEAYQQELETKILDRTAELRDAHLEALHLCELNLASQTNGTFEGFMDYAQRRWQANGVAVFKVGFDGDFERLQQQGPRPFPDRVRVGWRFQEQDFGYPEAHALPLGDFPVGLFVLGFLERSAFSVDDPAFRLFMKHAELGMRFLRGEKS
jgi:DNA-binding response OmpR family regulator